MRIVDEGGRSIRTDVRGIAEQLREEVAMTIGPRVAVPSACPACLREGRR